MKKLFAWSLLLATALAPASALALDTSDDYEVRIATAKKQNDAGTWYFSLDSSEDYTCNYAVEWISPSGKISTDCIFSEAKTHGRRSCLTNSQKNFETLVVLMNNEECLGFDEFELLQEVVLLAMGEDNSGELNGIILLDGPSGDVHSVEATPT